MSIHCAVLIPCLNEAEQIGTLVRGVREHVLEVIVIDDGSRDATAERAVEAGAEVIRHAVSRGKGAALRSGWERARERGFDWVLMMDGDGQHAPSDIPAFLACAAGDGAGLMIGNRMASADRMPWLRRVVNRWMSRRLSRMAGRELPDTQCGFRMINLTLLQSLSLNADHFETESELVLEVAAAGHPIWFVPIQVIYRGEASKIHPLVDTWRWFRWLSGKGADPGAREGSLRACKKIRAPK